MTIGAMQYSVSSQANSQIKLKPPPCPDRPIFLTFTDATEDALAEMETAGTHGERRRILKECMKIDQSPGFTTEILADMHYHNYNFCVSRNFSPDKTSTFLSIMKLVLEEAVSRRLLVDDAFSVFKEWLLNHSVQRPPYSIGIFTLDDVKAAMQYVHDTFFRHYRLYMYVYMTHCDIDFQVSTERGVALPPLRQVPLRAEDEVDPRAQPELAHLFKQSDNEQASAALNALNEQPEDKASLVKRKVEEGVKKLMKDFEDKLKEQDERFQKDLETLKG